MDYQDLSFLRDLNIFKKFTLKNVLESPLQCKTVQFEAGNVVVANSNESEWIYIVKSGSLSVLGRLQNVKPARKSETRTKPEVAVPYRKRRKRRSIVIGSRAPTIILPTFKNKVEMDLKMAATLPGYFSRHERLGILDYEAINKKLQSRVEHKPMGNRLNNFVLPLLDAAKAHRNKEVKEEGWVTEEEEEEGRPIKLPEIASNQKGTDLATRRSKPKESSHKQHPARLKLPRITDRAVQLMYSKDNFSRRIQDLDLRVPRNELSKVKGRHVFILIQVLQKGQHFGLTDMIFYDQPSVSLVSNGAECYMISKFFYRQNVPLDFMYDLKKTETPFPSEEDLQQQLQVKVDWRSESKGIYRKAVTYKNSRETRRQQFAVTPGEYNHRAGPT